MAASRPKKRARKARPDKGALFDGVDILLTRTSHLVRALEYVGYGLHDLNEDSADGVLVLATMLLENLNAARDGLRKLQAEA